MKTRSISDEEIALIKAMIGRSMANKDIQFFFNRPDRSVNSGRISGIRNVTYSNSAEIAAATDDELDAFLKAFEPSGVSASINVPQASEAGPVTDPVSAVTLVPGPSDMARAIDMNARKVSGSGTATSGFGPWPRLLTTEAAMLSSA
jgi:hypothetical protein